MQHISHVGGDDTRHALMVGTMAGTYGAHSIMAIDRRITNRHLIMLGNYPRFVTQDDVEVQAQHY